MDDIELMAKRLAADKQRPNQCECGHSKIAHDSGYCFCWFCDCNQFALDRERTGEINNA